MTVDHPSMNHFLYRWRSRARRRASVIGLLAVLPCTATASTAKLQKSDGIQGNWTAVEKAQTLDLGGTRSASILRLQGTIVD